MVIYQIHEHSGAYEDYRDIIVGSYLHKDKAIVKMEELQRIEAKNQIQSIHCKFCPIADDDIDNEAFDVVVQKCSMHCSHAKIRESDIFGYDCENWEGYWDDIDYEIKEVEVEE